MTDTPSTLQSALFDRLKLLEPDPLLSLIKLFADDPRPGKIDLGVGVYRDADGRTPVFRAVKAAEADLSKTQDSKSYLGPEGNIDFITRVGQLILPQSKQDDWFGVQTPGGTGALYLAAQLAAAARPGATVWLGTPSWPIHANIFDAAGLTTRRYASYDPARHTFDIDAVLGALAHAEAGDLVLLQGCGHNPTGMDPDSRQWQEIAAILARRGAVPLLDLAYHGLAHDLAEDLTSLGCLADAVDDLLVAYSCDKNFGLYRERVGAIFVRAGSNRAAVRSSILASSRAAWSMPPDHGAAAVSRILEAPELDDDWRRELAEMRERLAAVRQAVVQACPELAYIARQRGLFALLPLTVAQVEALRRDHGVYLPASGRINMAGLALDDVSRFAHAVGQVLT